MTSSPNGFYVYWRQLLRSPAGLLGLGIIGAYGLMAILHPLLMLTLWDANAYDPVAGFVLSEPVHPAAPSLRHLLGTDPVGRDVLSQLMFSARNELLLGLVAAGITVVVGTTVGAVSAYVGGAVDAALMRLADVTIMTPAISLLIVIGALFELNLFGLAAIVGLMSGFGGTAVILKSQALTLKARPYVDAAKVAGGSPWYIVRTHIMPHLLPLAFLSMMFTATAAVFSEAALSFFGVTDIRMSWGIMVHTAQTSGYLLSGTSAWWLVFPAGLSITLLSGSFYLVGRSLDEAANPRLRRR